MAIQRALFSDSITVVPFGSITAGFVSFATYSPNDANGNPIGFVATLVLCNYTNQDLDVSFATPSRHINLRIGEQRIMNFREADLVWAGSIFLRHQGVAPTSGNVIIEAIRSPQ